jgi:hypothetical protein
MDGSRFDRLSRWLAEPGIGRRALIGLVGGFLVPLLPGAEIDARNRREQNAVHAEKKRKNKNRCQPGLLTCKLKRKKKKALIFCKDGQIDPFNCGACGNTCATGQNCLGGVCTCDGTLCPGCCEGNTCRAGTSTQQCGAYGGVCQVCTGGSSCQGGVCTCPSGLTYCAGACVDTKTDAADCGSCGVKCTLPQTCGGGGTPGVCGCTKTTCEAEIKNCGTILDGCGGELECGACPGDETCGGGGEPNVCRCLPEGSPCERMSQCCEGFFCCEGTAGVVECRDTCG